MNLDEVNEIFSWNMDVLGVFIENDSIQVVQKDAFDEFREVYKLQVRVHRVDFRDDLPFAGVKQGIVFSEAVGER